MRSNEAPGLFSSHNREKICETRAYLPKLAGEKAFDFKRILETPHARREQRNREINRTVTGAYQGDIRRTSREASTGEKFNHGVVVLCSQRMLTVAPAPHFGTFRRLWFGVEQRTLPLFASQPHGSHAGEDGV
jgi:hypothetical protein